MREAIFVAAFGMAAWAKQIAPDSAPVVTVCLGWTAEGGLDYIVQEEVSKIFSAIPVRIAWKRGRACQTSDAIHIHLTGLTPPKLMPGALAFARPYQGTYIEVFYDRVCAMARPEIRTYVLAYVLAHEISHILQGVARHSETGIMKACWRDDDLQEMRYGALDFTVEDVRLIQAGLRTRTERLAAVANPTRASIE